MSHANRGPDVSAWCRYSLGPPKRHYRRRCHVFGWHQLLWLPVIPSFFTLPPRLTGWALLLATAIVASFLVVHWPCKMPEAWGQKPPISEQKSWRAFSINLFGDEHSLSIPAIFAANKCRFNKCWGCPAAGNKLSTRRMVLLVDPAVILCPSLMCGHVLRGYFNFMKYRAFSQWDFL